MRRFVSRTMLAILMGVFAAALCAAVNAQVVAPSLFTDALQVQGEPEGTEYNDWTAAGVTVADADPEDNPESLDIANVQVANDNDFIYIRATLHNTTATSLLNIFLAFDTDQDTNTGFNIFSLGAIGSEVGYQNDFPFAQYAEIFNLNLSLTGGPIGNGGALTFPFWTDAGPPSGTQMEWAVPLDAVIQYPPALGGPSSAFPNPSFNFAVYTSEGLGDISNVISYTLAEGPAGTPGDFDGDMDVDGADFLAWQRGFGPTYDATDLADWKANFGTVPSIASVPEPATLGLAALLAVCLHAGMRRQLSC